ncbi:MAG: dihydrodipicolinate synthase family protein [Acidobacteriota bacterium]
MNEPLHGILPPVTTPFSQHGEILYQALEANLKRYLQKPVSGFLLLGSNGESAHLSRHEKLEIVRLACRTVPTDRQLIVGVSFASLRDSASFAQELSGLPIDALLAATPSYFKNRMTDQALARYFSDLADRSPFPLLLYNVPQYSGIALSSSLIAELARHPNISGMKDSSGNLSYLQSILAVAGNQDFQVVLGSAQIFGPSLTLGIRAAILAVACALPELPARLMEAYQQGEGIAELQAELYEIAVALTTRYGVAGLKKAMDLAGFEGGSCRLPLLPLADEEAREIETILRSARLAEKLLVTAPERA